MDKHYIANARAIRAFLREIVEGKKAERDSAESDVLKLMLEDENYQDTEEILDDLFLLFIAGSKTVQGTTSNLITTMHLMPEERSRLLNEVDSFMKSVKENLMSDMDLDSLDQLEYLKMAYQESLRRDTPAPMGGVAMMTKDMKIKGVDFR